MVSVDSNVLVYLYEKDEPAKRGVAREVVATMAVDRAPLALQVVGEFFRVATRKLRMPRSEAADAARDLLASFAMFPYAAANAQDALSKAADGRLQYWDALLLSSAASAGVTTLFSEDMGDNEAPFGVRIVNPFGAGGALSPVAAAALDL